MKNAIAAITHSNHTAVPRPRRYHASPDEGFIRRLLSVKPLHCIANIVLLRLAETESARAKAVEGLGRSGSRMASHPLTRHGRSERRSKKTRGHRARQGTRDGVCPLCSGELEDRESDGQCEAAEALAG